MTNTDMLTTRKERKDARELFYGMMTSNKKMLFDTKRLLKSIVVDMSSGEKHRIDRAVESGMYLLKTYYKDN